MPKTSLCCLKWEEPWAAQDGQRWSRRRRNICEQAEADGQELARTRIRSALLAEGQGALACWVTQWPRTCSVVLGCRVHATGRGRETQRSRAQVQPSLTNLWPLPWAALVSPPSASAGRDTCLLAPRDLALLEPGSSTRSRRAVPSHAPGQSPWLMGGTVLGPGLSGGADQRPRPGVACVVLSAHARQDTQHAPCIFPLGPAESGAAAVG